MLNSSDLALGRRGTQPIKRLSATVFLVTIMLLQACAGLYEREPPPGAPSEVLQRAKAAYQASDYNGALMLLAPLAKQGDPAAQYALGYMYYYGQGVQRDQNVAWNWIEQSAEQDYPAAQMALRLRGGQPPKIPVPGP